MRHLTILLSLLLVGAGVIAQTTPADSLSKTGRQHARPDSARQKAVVAAPIHKKMIMSLDTLTMSDYTLSIERVNDNLNTIGDSARLGFEVVKIGRIIDHMTEDVKLIRQNMRGRSTVFNIKNQFLYQSFTKKLDDQTDEITAQLNDMYLRVYHAKQHLKVVLSDSIFRKLYADKMLRTTFDKKLVRLEWKWNRTDSLTKANVDTLNVLKVRISDNGLLLSNMLNMIDNRLDKVVPKLFGQEVNPIWGTEKAATPVQPSSQKTQSIFGNEQRAIGFYFRQTSGERIFLLILGILLFTWLYFKRKLVKLVREQKETFSYLNLQYLNNYPILSLLVLLLCLMPFFDAYAPTAYISIGHILLLLAATFIFIKSGNHPLLISWLFLVVLFAADILTYFMIEPSFIERFWLLTLHAGIIVFSVRFRRTLPEKMPYFSFIKSSTIVGIILAGLGILFNLFGRFSLSGIVGIAAIFAVTQAVALTIFIEVIIEVILLQLQGSRLNKGIEKPFDSSIVVNKIRIPLIFAAVIIWLIMLTSNLNIYHNIYNYITDALTETRTLGSISFQLISVIMFFVIIWIAHIVQRLLSFLFGEMGNELEDMTKETKGQHSRLLITRLLVLIAGYMLAIAASGLPIDKLTFLLGALGVGIGMGLQNIVNNIVSGIILIFDGSLQIGDEIEVGGQSGKVKEIGLRASTLNTPDGAEVIIPNGNILSQNIINWTYSSNEKRVILTFSLAGKELDANLINEIINTTILTIPNVISHRKPVILYTKVTPESCSLTIRFWSIISKTDQVKSEAMLRLSAAFGAKNIGFE